MKILEILWQMFLYFWLEHFDSSPGRDAVRSLVPPSRSCGLERVGDNVKMPQVRSWLAEITLVISAR